VPVVHGFARSATHRGQEQSHRASILPSGFHNPRTHELEHRQAGAGGAGGRGRASSCSTIDARATATAAAARAGSVAIRS